MRTLLHPRTVAGSSSTLSEKQYTYVHTVLQYLTKIICTSFYLLLFQYFHAYFSVINYSMQVKITGTSTSGHVILT